jgi:protein-tyrosine phosphatase
MGNESVWVPVAGGCLMVGHRPKLAVLEKLASDGATHVLTLLSEHEGALEIGEATEEAGMTWLWLPLSSRPEHADESAVRAALKSVRLALLQGGRVFVHCSAGIHRTGMIAYAILRSVGLGRGDACDVLRELRGVTADGVGESRLAWADRFASA